MGHSSGGAAAAGGFDFQNRVAAWAACQILAERAAPLPWGLAEDRTFDFLRCETEQPVDDLLIGISGGGHAFVQVKHRVTLSEHPSSELASALDQFVRQFLHCREHPSSKPWEEPLDPAIDRLVLTTSARSPNTVTQHLAGWLDRIRRLPHQISLEGACTNEHQRRALSCLNQHICSSWQASAGIDPDEGELREFLRLLFVDTLDLSDSGDSKLRVQALLREAVLAQPQQAESAWLALIAICSGLASNRTGLNLAGMREAIAGASFGIRPPLGFSGDIERLRQYSDNTVRRLSSLPILSVDGSGIQIPRDSTQAVVEAAAHGPMLVVGTPGAGKSFTLGQVANQLQKIPCDVVFLAVDRLAAQSQGDLRNEIGLEHDLDTVIEVWSGEVPGILIIDALDAARGGHSTRLIRDLINSVTTSPSRWTVLASVRKFDLRYSPDLQGLFSGSPPSPFVDSEFLHLRHVEIPSLTDEELTFAAECSPALNQLMELASNELRELLKNVFNLRLAGDLLTAGISQTALAAVASQVELLERYWLARVVSSDGIGDERELLLIVACRQMLAHRALRVNRSTLRDRAPASALTALLSSNVLTEWTPPSATMPEREVIAFSHNLLFDFAVARLVLRTGDLAAELEQQPDLLLIARPSFSHHFEYLWTRDPTRTQFWNRALQFSAQPSTPEVSQLVAPTVAGTLVRISLIVNACFAPS